MNVQVYLSMLNILPLLDSTVLKCSWHSVCSTGQLLVSHFHCLVFSVDFHRIVELAYAFFIWKVHAFPWAYQNAITLANRPLEIRLLITGVNE